MFLFPTNFEQRIHFDVIREVLRAFCQTELGRRQTDRIKCNTDFQTISDQLQTTWESLQLIKTNESQIPTLHNAELTPFLQQLAIDGTFLMENELNEIRNTVISIVDIENMLNATDAKLFPKLSQLNRHIKNSSLQIISLISAVLTPTGEINENASTELKQIRHEIFATQKSLDRILQNTIRKLQADNLIDKNTLPILREGRFAIPIPTANKRKIKGIIVDESDTGKTSFIEPQEVVETNNLYRSLQLQEQRERIRILKDVCHKLRPYIPFLNEGQQYIAFFDSLFAKAKLASILNATLPTLTNQALFHWRRTYSPILLLKNKGDRKKVVPFDLDLSKEDQRILVISGPNAGGKSVCLKTIVLVQYMLQCGILPPIDEGSTIGIFNKMIIDIGDDQSIENDISTYAAHLKNLKEMVKNAEESMLFLIDEAGNGTEPIFGGAIAQSVLEELANSSAIGVVTTHFTNIKMIATHHPVFKNAAMMFDAESLQPTYQMKIGQPGNSYAFEIANKIGLPATILQKAKESIGKEKVDYEQLLKNTLNEKKLLEDEKNTVKNQQEQLAKLITHYQKQADDLKKKKQTIIQDAHKQAQELLEVSNATIEKTIREIKEAQADKQKTAQARKKIDQLKQKIEPAELPLPKEKRVLHDFKELKPTKTTNSTTSSVATKIRKSKMQFQSTLDIRGLKADEALQTLMNYLDEAIMVNAEQINIIHGTGTGVLKQIVRSYLQQRNRNRKKLGQDELTYSDGDINKGGAGVTIVIIP